MNRGADLRTGEDPAARAAADAQAELDRLRHEAGGALTGAEIRRRKGLAREPDLEDPPLDWRPTPKNILLQLLGLALFAAVVWFLYALVSDSLGALFGVVAGEGADGAQ